MHVSDIAKDCWFLSGSTASGKTLVALELARRLDAEIISMDSMALYRGMDIGTAKPTETHRREIPHHLLDVVDPTEEFSVAQYVESARPVVDTIRAAGRQALIVGGTPLYLKSLLRGIFDGPPADWPYRERLEDEAQRTGPQALHLRLKAVDPATAERLHTNDVRRIIRALEVHHVTGNLISQQQTQFDEGLPASQCKVFVLSWPRELLYRRIELRVDQMFQEGLVDEVRQLLDTYGTLSRTAGQAVGYREVTEHLGGLHGLDMTIERMKTRTRQFAKRQETWFRSLSECTPVSMNGARTPDDVADEITQAGG